MAPTDSTNIGVRRAMLHDSKHLAHACVWVGFCASGKLGLAFTSIKINGKDYIRLLPIMRRFRRKKLTFQQEDNAAIHTGKKIKQWIKDCKFDLLDWPVRSPELHPVENLWDILVRRICVGGKQYASFSELKSAILEA